MLSLIHIYADGKTEISLLALKKRLEEKVAIDFEVARLEPLFKDQAEYDEFLARQSVNNVVTADLSTYEGNCYLGIDAGSTTTKAAPVSYTHLDVYKRQRTGYTGRR